MLAKFNQHIALQAFGQTPPALDLSAYLDNCDIEHILPVEASSRALDEFGRHDDEDIVYRFGNVVMIEAPINRLLGNRAYSDKRPVYGKSKFLLPRCQAENQSFGKADKITKAIQVIPAYPVWNEANIMHRQQFLVELAKTVWEVPAL